MGETMPQILKPREIVSKDTKTSSMDNVSKAVIKESALLVRQDVENILKSEGLSAIGDFKLGKVEDLADKIAEYLNILAKIESPRLKEKFVAELLDEGTINFPQMCTIISSLVTAEPEQKNGAKILIKLFLQKHGLRYGKVFHAWQSNAKNDQAEIAAMRPEDIEDALTPEEAAERMRFLVIRNIVSIQAIEAKQKGVSEFLHKNYGISNFGRFSVQTWLDQYNEKEKNGAYILILYARDDPNSSSYIEEVLDAYRDLHKEVHSSHFLRVIEVESIPKVARRLSKFNKKYQSPDFVILSGHSWNKEFHFGPPKYRKRNYKFFIGPKDFKGKGLERMEPYLKMFPPTTTVVMDSCSEGAEDSFVGMAAEASGNKFIHPKGETHIKDFGAKRDSRGNLSLNVEYDEAETVISEGNIIKNVS
jgi:hypothetical protein